MKADASLRELARQYYIRNGMTQKAIADELGLSEKTICAWKKEDNWHLDKEALEETPEAQIRLLQEELGELNHSIKQREPGKRYATPSESDSRLKILRSIKLLKEEEVSFAQLVAAGKLFQRWQASRDAEMSKTIQPHWQQFLKERAQDD